MLPLARELELNQPLICENGGVVYWPDKPESAQVEILGTPRPEILQLLGKLSERFSFRSFETLGLSGIQETTGLSEEAARRAADRTTNEPLLWEDQESRLPEFEQELTEAGLTLTKGGRFWHVAGQVNKGSGLTLVKNALAESASTPFISVALGDSPIDLPMLELADIACIIPGREGTPNIQLNHPHLKIATLPGSAGWNEVLLNLMDSQKINKVQTNG